MKAEDITIEWVLANTQFEQMSGCWFFDWVQPNGRRSCGRPYHSISIESPAARCGRTSLRLSRWMLAQRLGRPLRAGRYACHHCDTPECINPDHLYEGTAQTNSNDRTRRGRMWVTRPREEVIADISKALQRHYARKRASGGS